LEKLNLKNTYFKLCDIQVLKNLNKNTNSNRKKINLETQIVKINLQIVKLDKL